MLARLPEQIELLRLAETGGRLEGWLDLGRMQRLAPALQSTDGQVAVTLEGGVDDSGVHFLRGTVHAMLVVLCQRCLEPMRIEVESAFAIGMVTDEAQAEHLPGEYEPLIVEPGMMPLSMIIEDELILSLPIVTLHVPDECAAAQITGTAGTAPETERPNPFAVLADLKTGKKD